MPDGAAGGNALPGALAGVAAVTEQTDGVRLGELLAAAKPDTDAVEAALAQIPRDAAD